MIAIRVERVANQFRDVSLTEFVLLASSLNPREIEDVVDQGGQPLALFTNDAVILLLLFLSRDAPQLERFSIQSNQGQRRAQFVRYVRNEVGLQTGQRHFFADDMFGEHQAADYQQ